MCCVSVITAWTDGEITVRRAERCLSVVCHCVVCHCVVVCPSVSLYYPVIVSSSLILLSCVIVLVVSSCVILLSCVIVCHCDVVLAVCHCVVVCQCVVCCRVSSRVVVWHCVASVSLCCRVSLCYRDVSCNCVIVCHCAVMCHCVAGQQGLPLRWLCQWRLVSSVLPDVSRHSATSVAQSPFVPVVE